jgi:hypothetical protein
MPKHKLEIDDEVIINDPDYTDAVNGQRGVILNILGNGNWCAQVKLLTGPKKGREFSCFIHTLEYVCDGESE